MRTVVASFVAAGTLVVLAAPVSAEPAPALLDGRSVAVPIPLVRPAGPPPVPMPHARPRGLPPVPIPHAFDDRWPAYVVPPRLTTGTKLVLPRQSFVGEVGDSPLKR